jgi:hypothetical protein
VMAPHLCTYLFRARGCDQRWSAGAG